MTPRVSDFILAPTLAAMVEGNQSTWLLGSHTDQVHPLVTDRTQRQRNGVVVKQESLFQGG